MPAPNRPAAGLRRAAWDIAGLSAVDRAWILGQLSEQERDRLGQLVEEASAFGERDTEKTSAFERPQETMSVQRLPFSAAVLAQLPDWLAFRALLCIATDERARVLSEVSWARRRRLSKALNVEQRGVGVTAVTSAALLECLQGISFGPAVKT